MHSQIKKVVEALELLPQDWRVVPTFGKRPLGNSWQKINYSPGELRNKLIFNQMKINLKYKTVVPTGVAVVCGEYHQGHLIAIDCDGHQGWNKILEFACSQVIPEEPVQARKQALQYLPSTVAFTSGREFRAQFLYVIPETTPIKSVKLEHLELRANNLASVLPPSFHPEGRKYRWLMGCSPLEQEVVIAPDWVIQQMHGKYICSLSTKPYSGKTLVIQQMHRKPVASLSSKPYNGKTLCTHIPHKGKEKLISSQFDTDVQAALTFMEVLHPRFADNYTTWIQVGKG